MTQERRSVGPVKIGWQVKEILKRSLPQPIRQVLLSQDGEYLLVCTATTDYVYRTNGGAPLVYDCDEPRSSLEQSQKWATFSKKKQQIFEVHGDSQIITWERDGSRLRIDVVPPSEMTIAGLEKLTRNIYLIRLAGNLWAANDRNPYTAPIIWPQSTGSLSEAAAAKIAALTVREFDRIAAQVHTIVGLYRAKMVFVSIDHWVCSVRIDKSKFDDPVKYHFPMPHSWRRSNRPLRCLITGKGDIVFAVEGDLVVVKNSLPA